MPLPLDERCRQVEFLLGRWRGAGSGTLPGRDAFPFEIEIAFDHLGAPFLTYTQRTRHPDGRPSHQKAGYLRCAGLGDCELVVAQSGGRCDVATGTARGATLRLATSGMIGAPSAHIVTSPQIRPRASP